MIINYHSVEKSHRCTHLQNVPEWKIEYDGIVIEDNALNTHWLFCLKCSLHKMGAGWKIIKYPLGMPNSEKALLQSKVPF